MAAVWMAERGDGSWCALKVIHPYTADDDAVQGRFRREAEVAVLLRHRNIAGVKRAGLEAGQLFLDMELVQGVSLSALAERLTAQGASMPLGLLWRINDDVLRGLDYAHERTGHDGEPLGLVHRDLTPSNVLVGFDGVTRIIDFGMVRACLGAFQTMLGQIGGTPMYMSPEQARGRRVDRRSDLYAWATVMFEMLTGRRLVTRGGMAVMLKSILKDPAPRPRDVRTELPAALDPLFVAMLAKDPAQRPTSASAVRSVFDGAIGQHKWSEDDVGALVRSVFADRHEVFKRLGRGSTSTADRMASAMAATAIESAMTAPTVVRSVPVTEPFVPPAPRGRRGSSSGAVTVETGIRRR